ncbi:hypothetical protein GALL_507430 [mine drainage metagenome]|uniref:Uncharacterized protein n=1 Tax=mine drainage metagenome TaxID=410659 RepID=A0A1J5PQV9_9ZZZZ
MELAAPAVAPVRGLGSDSWLWVVETFSPMLISPDSPDRTRMLGLATRRASPLLLRKSRARFGNSTRMSARLMLVSPELVFIPVVLFTVVAPMR